MSPSKRGLLSAAFLVAAVSIVLYLPSLQNGFVSDDFPIVAENPFVQRHAPLTRLLALPYWPGYADNYRPLTVWTFALNARWDGAMPFHLVNAGLHAACSALVVLLAGALGLPAWPAAVSGLAFAALPVHVEAVDWIVGRSELLAALFTLAAWLTLYRCRSLPRAALGLGFFVLALLSKESPVAFPAAFALSELLGERERLADTVKRRAPVWLGALAALGLYLEWRRLILGAAIDTGGAYFSGVARPAAALTMARFFARRWVGSLATGAGLCAEYWRPDFPDSTLADAGAWLLLAAEAALAAWALRDFLKRRRLPALAVLIFLVLALPLLNVVVPLPLLGADRVMYLPSVGFCLLAGALWPQGRGRGAAVAAALAALAVWSFETSARQGIWRSDETLWTSTRSCAPDSPKTLLWQGQASDKAGRYAEARAFYERALAAQPNLEQAAFDVARSFYEEGRLPEAEASARALIARRPSGTPSTWCLLGVVAEARGLAGEAETDYRRALALDPGYKLARENVGLLLLRRSHRKSGT